MINKISDGLMARFNQGNAEAFERLYHLYFSSVLYFAKQFVTNHEEAEDITADTFAKLWRLHGNFTSAQKVKSFLHTAAKNSCMDYLRHTQVKTVRKAEVARAMASGESATTCDHAILASEFKRLIYAEIERLPEKCRLTFKLSFFEGLKNEEIATCLNLSEKTVRNLKAEAVKKIRIFIRPKQVDLTT